MGLLDTLMFWRKQPVHSEYEIDGCFTLPGADLDALRDANGNHDDDPVTGNSASPAGEWPKEVP